MPDQIMLLAAQSFGVAVGVFLGVFVGLLIRARSGKTQGLYRGSVLATAFLASMGAWAFAVLIRLMTGGAG